MNIPTASLTKAGLTDEKLRALFTAPSGTRKKKIEDLIKMSEGRIREGVDTALSRARIYRAIDDALEIPMHQLSHSLLKAFSSLRDETGSLNENEKRIAKDLGISGMIRMEQDPDTGQSSLDSTGKPIVRLHVPTFFQVFVPLVLTYCKARNAKLFNLHNTDPFLQYDPANPNKKDKLKCQITTARTSRMCNDTGVQDAFKQATWQALVYQKSLMLPRERWYRRAIKMPDDRIKIVGEGVRYHTPHITRTFFDQRFPFCTINTDSGCEYYGSWDMHRWGALKRNKEFWLEEEDGKFKIPAGAKSVFNTQAWSTYNFLYPTSMALPSLTRPVGGNDSAADSAFYYTQNEEDRGVPLIDLFQNLIPSEWDLGDYSEPVWFRWVSAYETTPLLVQPMGYRPGSALTYDDDQHRAIGTSLAMEVVPFQDQVGQLLAQYLDAVRSNAIRIVLYDSHMLPVDVKNRIEGGSSVVRRLELVPVDFDLLRAAGNTNIGTLFQPVKFDQMDTDQIMRSITMVVSLMERVLGFSAQEVGGSTQSGQTATSVTVSASYMQERHTATAGGISSGKAALKDSMYGAFINWGADEILATLEKVGEGDVEALQEMGFTVETMDGKAGVSGGKASLSSLEFAAHREGAVKGQDSAIAGQMLQVFQVIFSRPEIVQAVGVQTVIEWFNQIAIYAGLPTDMRLKLEDGGQGQPQGPTPEQVAQLVQQMLGQAIPQVTEQLKQEAESGLMDLKKEIADAIKTLAGRMSRVEGAVEGVSAA